jgi:hypothetical protein
VALKTKEDLEFIYYIDSKTYLPVKMERGRSVTMFSDYKEVDGIKAAHLLELTVSGLKMAIEKIEINPPIGGERFQLPEQKNEKDKDVNKDEGKDVDKK